MKTKKIEKRLSLNKNTVARLNGEMMDNARGGVSANCATNDGCTGVIGCEQTLEATCG